MVQFYFLQLLMWLLHFRVICFSSRNSIPQVNVPVHSVETASFRLSAARKSLWHRKQTWQTIPKGRYLKQLSETLVFQALNKKNYKPEIKHTFEISFFEISFFPHSCRFTLLLMAWNSQELVFCLSIWSEIPYTDNAKLLCPFLSLGEVVKKKSWSKQYLQK